MATTIQIKRSTGSSDPSSLAAGELAYTLGNNKLFIGDGSSPRVIGGKVFSDKLDHTDGILTASSAITTDSNSKVDTIKLRGADNSTNTNYFHHTGGSGNGVQCQTIIQEVAS